jgi:SIR2-like domain
MRGMDNTVVLLGAGASVEAGVPASFEMTRAILDALNTRTPLSLFTEALNYVCGQLAAHEAANTTDPAAGVDIERVFEALEGLARRSDMAIAPFVTAWQRDVDDLERRKLGRTWMRRKASAIWRRESGGEEEINDFWNQILPSLERNMYDRLTSLVVDELCRQLVTKATDVGYLEPLVTLGAKDGGITVATLNYDRAVEQASAHLDMKAYTGLDAWIATRDWAWPDDGLRLLKLHGSIDWYWKKPNIPAIDPRFRIETVREEHEEPSLFRPALLFGHGSKLRVEGPFLSLLTEFERLLASATTLVVVGYSFRDTHINYVVARWLADDARRDVIVIDPSFPDVKPFRVRNPRSFREELFYGLSESKKLPRARLHVIREPASAGLRSILA